MREITEGELGKQMKQEQSYAVPFLTFVNQFYRMFSPGIERISLYCLKECLEKASLSALLPLQTTSNGNSLGEGRFVIVRNPVSHQSRPVAGGG